MTPAKIDRDLMLWPSKPAPRAPRTTGPTLSCVVDDLVSTRLRARHETTNIIRGIRYRGVRIFVSSKFEDE